MYDDYTRMMLFANTNKHKLMNINEEMAAIQEAHDEILKESQDQNELLNSINGLQSRLKSLQEEVDAILYQYGNVNEMLHQVDIMISDYYKLDIEMSSYELNGMEQDLLGVKDEYKQFKLLKSEIGAVSEKISSGERI
jgi:chromosome segregation ATPase